MTDSAKALGGANKARLKIINRTILLLVLMLAAYLIWNHYHNSSTKYSTPPGPASIQEVAKANDIANNNFLKSGDYTSYQNEQQIMAQQYLTNKDSANAEKVMNDVFTKVPQNQISAVSYEVMASIQKAKGDTTAYKHYLQLAIDKLNQTGNSVLANEFQTVLNGIK